MAATGGSAGRASAYLLFLCIVATLGGFLFGLDAIVISGTIAAVDARFALSSFQEGLFVSSSLIGCAAGALAAGPLCDGRGRRAVMIGSALVISVGVALCVAADSTRMLILSRCIGGVGVGLASVVCPLYIAELSPQRQRGRLVSLYQLAITVGIVTALVTNVLIATAPPYGWTGALFGAARWRAMFAVQLVPAGLFMILATILPESPRFLAVAGRVVEARALLARLVGAAEADEALQAPPRRAPLRERYKRLFSLRRDPLGVALALAAFSELSGITVVFYYGPLLIARLHPGGGEGGIVLLGIVNMLATPLSLWLIDRVGRRTLLLYGCAICAAALSCLGLLLAWPASPVSLVIALICLFICIFACTIGPVKFVIASEIFPADVRAEGAGLATSMVWLTGAVVNQLFPIVRDRFGAAPMFFGFAALTLGQFLFVARYVPETANLSLEHVGELWTARA